MNLKPVYACLTGAILCGIGLMASCASPSSVPESTESSSVPQDTSPGDFDKFSYDSTTTGTKRNCWVWTPHGLNPAGSYPVLYVLHGIGGTEDEWINNARPQIILDDLLEQKLIQPMIVVFPNGRAMKDDSVPQNPFGPEAVEAFSNFGNDLMKDLIPWIESRYPAAKDRNKRGICGLSMGGGQSLNFGLGMPESFNYVGAFSAAPNTDTEQFKLDNKSLWPKIVWLSCGLSDGLLQVSQKADDTLTELGVPHTFHTMPGNHDWSVWTWSFTTFVQLVFKQ